MSQNELLSVRTWSKEPADHMAVLRVWQLFEPSLRKLSSLHPEDEIIAHFGNLLRSQLDLVLAASGCVGTPCFKEASPPCTTSRAC